MMVNLCIAKNGNYLNESVIRFGVQMMTFLENSFIDRQGGLGCLLVNHVPLLHFRTHCVFTGVNLL